MNSSKLKFGLLSGSTILVALTTLGLLTWFEIKRPLYTGLSRLQHEINRNPQIYGRKAYLMSVYISHMLYAVACMLVVVLAPFVLVLGSIIAVLSTTNKSHKNSDGHPVILASLVANVVIHFAANALLIGAVASSLSSVIDISNSGFAAADHRFLHSSIGRQRNSLNEDLHLLVTRAKFRNSQAVQLMDDLQTLFACCGVRGSVDWTKPPYEQPKHPNSCKNAPRIGCTHSILKSVAKHRLLAALASICLLAVMIPTQWICIMLIGRILVRKPGRKNQNLTYTPIVKNGEMSIVA